MENLVLESVMSHDSCDRFSRIENAIILSSQLFRKAGHFVRTGDITQQFKAEI